jgi:hypothetical protein
MSLLKKPLLIVTAILALAAFTAPSAASASELWYDSNEEALPGPANPTAVSGSGEIEIRTVATPGIRINCEIPSVSGAVWNKEAATGQLNAAQFGNSQCDFRNEWYPPSWDCKGTVTAAMPWTILAVGDSAVQLGDVKLSLDGTKCNWWSGSKPETLEGSLIGAWDNEQQTITWNSANGVQLPSGGSAWTVNGSIALDAESESEGPNLTLK